MQRRDVLYSGWVQGVGFRYSVCRLASDFAVTGFVRNLSDGRVHLVVEGLPPELDRFLGVIRAALSSHIREVETDRLPATGEYTGFVIQ